MAQQTSTSVTVKFEPSGRIVHAMPGAALVELAGRAGLIINMPCGGAGTCGNCRVRFLEAAPEPSAADHMAFDEAELDSGWRLACQCQMPAEGSFAVDVPDRSLFGSAHQILEQSGGGELAECKPAVRKQYVELPQPSLTDDAPDLMRLEQAVGPLSVGVPMLQALPGRLRANGFKGTAVLWGSRLIDFEPGDTTSRCFGVAVDVGTTTVVASLIDLVAGRELGVASCMNPQMNHGDDVLSRIGYAGAHADGTAKLHQAMIGAIGELLERLWKAHRVHAKEAYAMVFSGNTTMESLLLGLDPAQLGQVPFVPAFGNGIERDAAEVGMPIHPRGRVFVFPVVGGFVGGDTVACMLASQLTKREGTTLLIDVGTNGEIVLSHGGKVWAASTAAGPAFEGARISCGMRATTGAIEKVVIDEDLQCAVIGDSAPRGLCGSGLIDLASELLRVGILTFQGRILPPDELPESLPERLRRRVKLDEHEQTYFVLEPEERIDAEDAVYLHSCDVRELQLASGAIRAGISILLKTAGLEVSDLNQVLIAGGFGSFIRRSHAQRIGLLPEGIEAHRIEYIGNASLGGAKWALLSGEAQAEADRLARLAEHVELSNDPDFAMEFAMAMQFPM